jgi:uncharacterized coiled-coil protein SlyX
VIENPFEREPRDDDVERLLAAYTAARLEPSRDAADRTRREILAAAWAPRVVGVGGGGGGFFSRGRRLAAAALLAAVLAVAFGGATLAASPGSPFYGLRLWVEESTLPTEADARADAQLELLAERLAEAQEASASGNGSAVSAALAAYRDEVADLLLTVDGDEARLAKLEAALGTHLVVLETLANRVPDQARDAIRNAIEKSTNAVDKVHESQGKPAKSPEPGSTPKPDKSPKPNESHGGGPPSPHPTPRGNQP